MKKITMKQRFGRATLVGIAGAAVATAIMHADSAFRFDYGFLRAATMGAFLAGLMMARGFGGQGLGGWFRAGLSFGAATVIGAIIAVPMLGVDEWLMGTKLMWTLRELLGGVLLGPAYVLSLIGGKLMVLKVWLAIFIASQGALVWKLSRPKVQDKGLGLNP